MRQFKILYVYILRCSDGSYYAGITNNMELRLKQHNSEIMIESYTYSRRPVELLYCKMFTDYMLAISTEKKLRVGVEEKKKR
jgi:putative endonuclease